MEINRGGSVIFVFLFFISFLGPKFELYGSLSPTTLLLIIKSMFCWLVEVNFVSCSRWRIW